MYACSVYTLSDTGKLRWSAEEQQRMIELVDACTVLVDPAIIGKSIPGDRLSTQFCALGLR